MAPRPSGEPSPERIVASAPAGPAPGPEASFEEAAARTGLVLPARRRLHPWVAVGIVAVLVGASIGVGELTGWAIGPRHGASTPGIYGAQQCQSAPSYLSVNLTASVSGHADPVLVSALKDWGHEFSNWSGGCVHVDGAASSGDGFVPNLAEVGVDAVATDALPNASDRDALPAAVTLVPVAAVAVEVVYNLPGLSGAVRLSGAVLAGMFNGSISSWDDPAIATLNPSLDLASAPAVVPVYRSDTAGVNDAFTRYLADSSATWNGTVGIGSSVDWPSGVPANSSAAEAAALAATPGAVGYLEAGPALPENTSAAAVENPTGVFVLPSGAGASAAVVARQNSTAAKAADWANLTLVDAPGATSYPITEFAFFAVYHDLGTAYADRLSQTNATWLLTFVWWLAGGAGTNITDFGLGVVPSAFFGLDQVALEAVLYNGGSLLENSEGGEGGETGEF